TQAGTATVTTTNLTTAAASITVNTAAGGTGNAVLAQASIGADAVVTPPTPAGGTLTVAVNAGSILWSTDAALGGTFSNSLRGLANGGSNALTLRSYIYNLTATGATSAIGTDARPLQITNFGADGAANAVPNLTAAAGSGGIYVTSWVTTPAAHDLTTGTL